MADRPRPEGAPAAFVLLTPKQLHELVLDAVRAALAERAANAPPADELLDVATAARELGVSTRHVRRMIAMRELRPVRLGRRVLVPRAELTRLATPRAA